MNKQSILVALNIAAIFAAFLFGRCSVMSSINQVIISTDTITILRHDTIRVIEPKLVYERVVSHDTIFSSIQLPDTTFIIPVEMDRVQREFHGTNYHAWVSGCCEPWLDKIDVYNDVIEREITIHEKAKPKPWGLGIQAGATYDFSSKKPSPYIGIGISYNIFQW